MSQLYERELKGILTGDPEVIKRITQNLPQEEAIPYMEHIHHPFAVVRAAGSLGVDMAVVGVISFLVEEKSSVKNVFHFNSPRVVQQALEMKEICLKAGVTPVYAYRYKRVRERDPWRLFSFDIGAPNYVGYQRYIYYNLFKDKNRMLEYTRDNNYVMRWEHGLPLHEFLARVDKLQIYLPEGEK